VARFGKWLLSNWIWIVVGCILTKLAIEYAYIERGYKAYGGEWLTLPLILLIVSFVKDVIREVKWFREEEEHEIRFERNRRRLQKRRAASQRRRG